jgi:hypothetical protein
LPPASLTGGFQAVEPGRPQKHRISNLAQTQMQTMQMSFFILLPSIVLSGFMFPREAMPEVIRWIGNLIPLNYKLPERN